LKEATMSDDVYERLADALDRLPNGFPRTASGVENAILKHLFSPEEANLALQVGGEWTPLPAIAERMGMAQREARAAPYTREEVLEYLALCRRQIEERLPSTAFDAQSGFYWLPFNKLELQFYNIRHIQHHVGELYERLAATGGADVGWAAMHPAEGEERR